MSFPRECLFHLIPKRGPPNDDVTLLREDDSSVSPNQHMRRIGDDPIQLMHPTFILLKKLRPRNDNHAGFVSRPSSFSWRHRSAVRSTEGEREECCGGKRRDSAYMVPHRPRPDEFGP